jgi:hypothetical protein
MYKGVVLVSAAAGPYGGIGARLQLLPRLAADWWSVPGVLTGSPHPGSTARMS